MRRPRRRPETARQLQRLVQAYVREYGLAEKRVRDWISYLAICGVLERAGALGQSPPHFVKGGIALELRLSGRARASKDLDLAFRAAAGADLVQLLEDALDAEYEGFTFRRARAPHRLPTAAARVELSVQYVGRAWGRVILDLAHHEGHEEIELVNPRDLAIPFGVTGPERVPVIGLRWHVAQKLHAVSRPSTVEHPNERVQDAADVILLKSLITDLVALREACERVFTDRGTHAWPPILSLPTEWATPYARLADELELAPQTLEEATATIAGWIETIQATS